MLAGRLRFRVPWGGDGVAWGEHPVEECGLYSQVTVVALVNARERSARATVQAKQAAAEWLLNHATPAVGELDSQEAVFWALCHASGAIAPPGAAGRVTNDWVRSGV